MYGERKFLRNNKNAQSKSDNMKTKTEYRIIRKKHHRSILSFLQFKHNGEWYFIKDDAISLNDCSKTLPFFGNPYNKYYSSYDDDDLLRNLAKAYPDIEDFFTRNKRFNQQPEQLINEIIYL